jgi:AraC family transcriptional regulator
MLIDVTNGSEQEIVSEVVGFRVTNASFPPLRKLDPHYHERACLAIVLDGGIENVVPRPRRSLGRSTAVMIPPAEMHHFNYDGGGTQMLFIEPGESMPVVGDLVEPYAPLLDRVCHFDDGALPQIGWRITSELRAPDSATPLAVGGLVLEALASAMRRGDAGHGLKAPAWLRRVREYIHATYLEPVEIITLAEIAGVHPAHLSRVFREQTGQPVGAYVRRLRIDWAANELVRTDASLSDIALRAGFADQSHFTRAFKRQIGLTPGCYRKPARRYRS